MAHALDPSGNLNASDSLNASGSSWLGIFVLLVLAAFFLWIVYKAVVSVLRAPPPRAQDVRLESLYKPWICWCNFCGVVFISPALLIDSFAAQGTGGGWQLLVLCLGLAAALPAVLMTVAARRRSRPAWKAFRAYAIAMDMPTFFVPLMLVLGLASAFAAVWSWPG